MKKRKRKKFKKKHWAIHNFSIQTSRADDYLNSSIWVAAMEYRRLMGIEFEAPDLADRNSSTASISLGWDAFTVFHSSNSQTVIDLAPFEYCSAT